MGEFVLLSDHCDQMIQYMARICFSPQAVNEVNQLVGSHSQAAIMHKWFGLELNIVKGSSNA